MRRIGPPANYYGRDNSAKQTVECDNGHCYELSASAVKRLRAARNGRDAELVFEGFANHVDRADRGRVWLAL